MLRPALPLTIAVRVPVGAPEAAARHTVDSFAQAGVRVETATDDADAWQAALAAGETEWFALVEAGTDLDPDGLAVFGSALRGDGGAALVYSDEHALPAAGGHVAEILKPGWSPRLLLDGNYLGSLCAFRRKDALTAGGFSADDVLTGGYDLALRLADAGATGQHAAVTTVRRSTGVWPVTARPEARAAGRRAAEASLRRRGISGTVREAEEAGTAWHRVMVRGERPCVTVVIPTRDRVELLRGCVASVEHRTDYPVVEIVIVDNGSTDPATLAYLAASPHRVVRHPGPFNFSAIVNAAVSATTAPLVLLLNNDTEVMERDWLDTMVAELADPAVGAVGCRLVGVDGTAQHEGIALGIAGAAAVNLELDGYLGLDRAVRDVAAVTAACVLFPRTAFDAIGGFDVDLAVGWGDVDFCLRLRRAGYRVIYTPHTVVQHLGQASRGTTPHRDDDAFFAARWPLHRARDTDPFVNRRIEGFAPLRRAEVPPPRPGGAGRARPVA